MSEGVIVDFNNSSVTNGIHIEMPSCWGAVIPVEKISLIRQEEYVEDCENVLEAYIHLSEPEGTIEHVRLQNVSIQDLMPLLPEGEFLSLLSNSDIDPENVVPFAIAKKHIDGFKDEDGRIVQVNVKDCIVVSKCLVPYQMTSEVIVELDELFSQETDQYGWRMKTPVLA